MKLDDAQAAQYAEQGYVLLPGLFSDAEVKVLIDEVPGIYAQRRDEVVREKDGETVRSAFAAHNYSEAFRRLSRHPRLIEPAMQLVDGPVYIHQFKINAKAAFNGDVWQWHQDYGTWSRDDLMPEPRALNLAVFLDEVNQFNGPLLFIPGSHKGGVIEAGHDVATTSYPLWTIDNHTILPFHQTADRADMRMKFQQPGHFHEHLLRLDKYAVGGNDEDRLFAALDRVCPSDVPYPHKLRQIIGSSRNVEFARTAAFRPLGDVKALRGRGAGDMTL